MIPPVVHRALVLLSCTFLGLICGTLYLYSSYSPQYARRLHYTVLDSLTIALMGTLGIAVAGPVAGTVVDKTGYTIPLLLGGAQLILGYIGMKYQYDIQYSSVTLSALILFGIGSGLTFVNSTTLKCCAVTFPSIRGMATSLPLAFYGLSAMFYSVIASAFFHGDTSLFLGFLAYLIAGIFIICAPLVIMCDYTSRIPTYSPLTPPQGSIEMNTLRPFNTRSSLSTPQLSPRISIRSNESVNIGGMHLFHSQKFWLIFVITGTLASLGQMYIYSVGYMVKALISFHVGEDENIDVIIQGDQQLQVGLLLIANCIGRILSGIAADLISQQFKKPRSWLLFIPTIGFMATQLMGLQIQHYQELSLDSLMTGLFYGFTFCIIPIIIGDIFGMENFLANWGIVGLAPILPSFYFTHLFGKIYDSNSVAVEGGTACLLGHNCYGHIFWLTLGLTFVTLGCVLKLNWKQDSKRDPQ